MKLCNKETLDVVIRELNTVRRVLLNLRELSLDEAICMDIIRSCINGLEQKVLNPLTIELTQSNEKEEVECP